MYLDNDVGRRIQALRVERGITQEALSEGLCAVSTISRIENGSQVPRQELFQNIMERLGEPGFLRGAYFEPGQLDHMAVRRNILEAFEYDDMYSFEVLLHDYQSRCEDNDAHSIRFIEYMKLLYWEKLNSDSGDHQFVDRGIRIMSIIRKEFSLDYNPEDFVPDGMEFLVLNGIMMHLEGELGDKYFSKIFNSLIKGMDKMRHFLPAFWKIRAALYNNLAVWECKRGRYTEASECLRIAFLASFREGGLYFFLKIMRTRYILEIKCGDEGRASMDLNIIRLGLSFVRNERMGMVGVEGFLKENNALMIF